MHCFGISRHTQLMIAYKILILTGERHACYYFFLGALGISVSLDTEQKLNRLFGSGGSFVLPKGVTNKLKEMGDNMHDKVQ